jgi:DNA polymerase-3 subunit epsilon
MKIVTNEWAKYGSGPNWTNAVLLGMDTETTMAEPMTARFVTSAIMLDIPDQEQKVWEWLSAPGLGMCSLEATAIHGISDQYANENGQKPEDVIREMYAILSALQFEYNAPLVMTCAPFDLTILNCESQRLGLGKLEDNIKLPNIIDTLTIDRMIDMYRRGRRTLTSVAANYGIVFRYGAHQAKGDIDVAIRLARAIGKKYPRLATCNLNNLQQLQKEFHKEWLNGYTQYRQIEDPDFFVTGDWPYVK